MSRISVVCLDMAGTTVRDEGTVMSAFTAAITAENLPAADFNAAMRYVRSAMGRSKIEVMPGAEDLFRACRAAGIKVCLATGFSPATRDAIAAALGWGSQVDLVLSPADAGRGRPWPDLPLTALLRLGGGSVHELAVAGDTPSDVESGLRAGAAVVAGVLTGESSREELAAAPGTAGLPGTPLILDSVADLRPHLGI